MQLRGRGGQIIWLRVRVGVRGGGNKFRPGVIIDNDLLERRKSWTYKLEVKDEGQVAPVRPR